MQVGGVEEISLYYIYKVMGLSTNLNDYTLDYGLKT